MLLHEDAAEKQLHLQQHLHLQMKMLLDEDAALNKVFIFSSIFI